jgi:coenzyme F420-0:L-glutamate ligase/coenzyme F420-1:gamma-L-glutamate ligase
MLPSTFERLSMSRMRAPIQIFPLSGLPEIRPGADLPRAIVDAARAGDFKVLAGDVFVVAQKVVSKAEGRIVSLDSVSPSDRALEWASKWGKDPRVIELVLDQTKRVVRMAQGVIVAETGHGFVCANAGVDVSNAEPGTAILLPLDPDASARALLDRLEKAFGLRLGVIIADTFGRPWREGLVNVALGVAGLAPFVDYRGRKDASGKTLQATLIAVADELASAAELVMGKTDGIPVAIIRGAQLGLGSGAGRELIRPAEKDLFR